MLNNTRAILFLLILFGRCGDALFVLEVGCTLVILYPINILIWVETLLC